jgi:hypothetical protein
MADQKTESPKVVDFNRKRAEKLEDKRRKTERIFLRNLIGVYSVIGDRTMKPIEIIDLSEEGCSFQVPFDPKALWPAETTEIPIRMYFSGDTYIPMILRVQNSTSTIGEGGARFVRYGCSVDTSLQSYQVYREFVRFMRLYSEHAHRDQGGSTHFYL